MGKAIGWRIQSFEPETGVLGGPVESVRNDREAADDEPGLDWFNRPRNPSNPHPDGFDQSPEWMPEEIQLDDGGILVLEYA